MATKISIAQQIAYMNSIVRDYGLAHNASDVAQKKAIAEAVVKTLRTVQTNDLILTESAERKQRERTSTTS